MLDTLRGFADFRLGNFSPLSVPFDGHWDKNFSELPIRLQAEVDKVYDAGNPQPSEYQGFGTKSFFDLGDAKLQRVIRATGRDLWWDLHSPEQRRRKISEWDSRHYPETSAEEFIWMAEQKVKQRKLRVEIKRWEEMNTQGVPSEEKIKNEMLDKLHAELTELEKNYTPFVGFMEQGDPDTVVDTTSKTNDRPPCITEKMVAITKYAITAAWEIECRNKRKASAKEVIKMLQDWVASKKYAELIKIIPHGVMWMTSVPEEKPYNIDTCRATLKSWHKKRAEAETEPRLRILDGD